ncbi:MAG: ribonuclease III [Chloroflexi bacterium]|nr:ribonuclease III [Chloroflexota bacterium]
MPVTIPDGDELAAAQSRLGVRFNDPSLLRVALTHQSYLNENPSGGAESNERLEFLGDSALNYIIGRHLYERLPDLPEGDLTVRRAEAVRRETLEKAARRLGIGDLLVLGMGEHASGGAGRSSNMANGFEALVGAAVLDQGIEMTIELVLRWLEPELEALIVADTPKDPKSRLQELLQSRGDPPPEYRVVSVEGPDNQPEFTIEAVIAGEALGRGVAGRKVDAEREAATQAVAALE